MMKINYPEPQEVFLPRADGKRVGEKLDLGLIVQRFVLPQEICREKSSVKIARALLRKLPAKEVLKDEEHEALEKWMKLSGTQIAPELNTYYLECLDAVYDAVSTND
jgi:hypothetical protein